MRVASPIPHKRARIEIIPLIDIMFFLLASFMMVSLSQIHMKGIKVALPSTAAAPPGVKDYVSVTVREGDSVYFDGQYVPPDQVVGRFYQLYQKNHDIKVSISASMLARHGDVIDVLDQARRVGIKKIGYQIRAAPAAAGAAPAQPH